MINTSAIGYFVCSLELEDAAHQTVLNEKNIPPICTMKNMNVFVMTVTSILFTAFSTFKYQKVTHCALETDMFRFQVYKNTTKSSLKYMKSLKIYFSTIGMVILDLSLLGIRSVPTFTEPHSTSYYLGLVFAQLSYATYLPTHPCTALHHWHGLTHIMIIIINP